MNFRTSVKVTEIGDNYVNYTTAEDNEQAVNDVDYVYYATGVKPNDSLFNQIKDLGINVKKVGDALNPQTVMEAVAKGYKLANNV